MGPSLSPSVLSRSTSNSCALDPILYILPPYSSLLDIGKLYFSGFKSQERASKGTSSSTSATYFTYYASIILIADSCQCLIGLSNALAHCFITHLMINSLIVSRKLFITLVLLKAGFYNTFSI